MNMLKTFGRNPTANQIQSSNFKNLTFQNQPVSPRKVYLEGHQQKNTWQIAFDFFVKKKPENVRPLNPLPSIKHNLNTINADQTPCVVWMGHSSYFIKYKQTTFLVDPVMSGYAAPFPFAIQAFAGADIYSYNDIPQIDYLIITHDHYDHLDYKTVLALKNKTKNIITHLGVGEHFKSWGFKPEIISELDWWQDQKLPRDLSITSTPAQHFSGRTFDRNRTLWGSFVLELEQFRIYIGGDSGYGIHFEQIGQKFKSFDLALLECGQYNPNWPDVHMFPEETAQAGLEIGAKVIMPVHWGKFVLSTHDWTEPVERVLKKATVLGLQVTTPYIGEPVYIGEKLPQTQWWK